MSSKKTKILIIEDNKDLSNQIRLQLEGIGHEVDQAYDDTKGIQKTIETLPDIIILDVLLPEETGYNVCREIKRNTKTRDIGIIMLTNLRGQEKEKKGLESGTDFYLTKPYNWGKLEIHINTLLSRKKPYMLPKTGCSLSLNCFPGRIIHIDSKGRLSLSESSKMNLLIDTSEYANRAKDAYEHKSRQNIKLIGKDLYKAIFIDHDQIFGTYNLASGRVNDADLQIRFIIDRGLLSVPFEFLFNDKEYFVLKHPFARTIRGIDIRRKQLSPTFFNSLWEEEKSLKILLIASNTPPLISGVDQEFDSLNNSLKNMFEEKGLSVELKAIPTSKATYETVRNELENCKYHIVHYAGHGVFESENSNIRFWEKENMQGQIKSMGALELKMLLKSSDVSFFCLSCCWGTATDDSSQLYYDDFIGLADALIHAGIPSILGFRWPVSDRGAIEFSTALYKSLSDHGQIDKAVMNARSYLSINRNDFTWISPILIMQD